MAFETIRESRPPRTSNCLFCGKDEVDGTVVIAVKDSEAKTVISRNLKACEQCAVEQYEEVLGDLTAKIEANSTKTTTTGKGK